MKFFHYCSKCLYSNIIITFATQEKFFRRLKCCFAGGWWQWIWNTAGGNYRSSFYSIPLYVQPLLANISIHILFWTLLWCVVFLATTITYSHGTVYDVFVLSLLPATWAFNNQEIPRDSRIEDDTTWNSTENVMKHTSHCMHSWHFLRLGLLQLITINNNYYYGDFFFAPKSFALFQLKCLLSIRKCLHDVFGTKRRKRFLSVPHIAHCFSAGFLAPDRYMAKFWKPCTFHDY